MATPKLSERELAESYGFAMAVLNSNSELKRLFHKAVAETWTASKFQAEVRATKWFQNHSETWRNAQILKASDPTTYKRNVADVRRRLAMIAAELGAAVSTSNLDKIASTAYDWGWDDNQVRQHLATYVTFTDGRMIGQAGQWEQELRNHAAAQGVSVSDSWLKSHIRQIVAGKKTFSDAQRALDQYAISAYPHLADRIRAGETVEDIASPYMQTMATTLELNPNAVTLRDPTIRKALAWKDDKGNPTLRTLYDFEVDLRKDDRWLRTKNAQDAAMSTTNRVLRDMGLVS